MDRDPCAFRRRLARVAVFNFLRYWATGDLSARLAWRGLRQGIGFALPTAFDADLFRSVVVADEYRLHRHRFRAGDVIVDVGGHIGCFGLLCHLLGSRRIVSYEAHTETAALLERNYRRLGGARGVHAAVLPAAVLRAEGVDVSVRPSAVLADGNTGARTVLFDGRGFDPVRQVLVERVEPSGIPTPVVSLDDVLGELGPVRLLKLDGEGSELPLLLTSERLREVEEIVGEYHEIEEELYLELAPGMRADGRDAFRFAEVRERLVEQGFSVDVRVTAPRIGLFWARRPDSRSSSVRG